MRMYRKLCWLPFSAVLLLAADAPWQGKALEQWDENDAKQVLGDSPWVKFAEPLQVRDMSPDERRDSGNWEAGIAHGIGITALIGMFGDSVTLEEAIQRAHEKPKFEKVAIRWESSAAVRTAEIKAGEVGVPALAKDHYAIVVYDLPTPKRWNLEHELKGVAFLRRTKKKDVRPSDVQVLRQANGKATIVYLFPLSAEISKSDGRVEFLAQVGRLVVSQSFYPADMQVQGESQL